MKQRLFCYGTLKQGYYFHDAYLGNGQSDFIGPAIASSDYSLYVGAQPHLIRETTDKPVKGELYEIDNELLGKIDNLEGHPVIYKRELIEIYLADSGEKILAWAYLRHPNFKDKKHCFKEIEYV